MATLGLYGDFFWIAGLGVVIMGAGKSYAGRAAAEMGINPDNVAAQDCLELSREGRQLSCRYVGPQLGADRWRQWNSVDFLVLCLPEQATRSNFTDRNRALEVCEVDLETFANGVEWYFEYIKYSAAVRMPEFRALVEPTRTRFAFVPWMETYEAKGALMRDYFVTAAAG